MAARRRGIGFKLTLAVLALLLAALVTSTGLANYIISLAMDKTLRERMDDATRGVKAAFEFKLSEIEVFAEAFAGEPEYQRRTSYRDTDSLRAHVKELAQRAKLDLVIAQGLDTEGGAAAPFSLAAVSPPGIAADKFLQTPVYAEATKKHELVVQPAAVDGRPFLMAVSPVNYFGKVIGYLVCGREFTTAVAQDLKSKMGAEVGMIVGKGLVAHTVAMDATDLARFLSSLEHQQKGKSVIDRFRAGGQAYYVTGVPITNGGGRVGTLVVAQSQRALIEARRRTLRNFIGVSIVLAVLGALLGLLLARRISHPIVAIEEKFRQILSSGDLALRVPEQYKDEIGSMARTFNEMQARVQELHQRLAESERRMRQELEMAAVVQEMLFPPLPPESPAIELSSFVATSSETGGDWYGFVVNPRANTTTIIVGDVTGHGVPAALVTAIVHGFFRAIEATAMGANVDWIADALKLAPAQRQELSAHLAKGLPLPMLLHILNRVLIDSTKGSLFLTLFVSTLHHETRILEYVNAAHNLPLVLRTASGRPEVGVLPAAPSNRLGDSAELRLSPRRVQLNRGDTVIWFTDGLIECENEKGEEWGQKRLTRLIARSSGMDAASMKDRIVNEAYKFFGNQQRKDDITLVVGRIK